MSKVQQTNSSGISQRLKMIEVSALGALRGLVSLPFEHPFDTLKTMVQSQNLTSRQGFAYIYQNKGLKGFYSGFVINAMRVMSKSAYRWPLNVYLIMKFRKIFESYNNSRTIAGVVTGIATALLESGIICPFERIKVWLMTSPEYRQFFSYFRVATVKTIFDGFFPVMLKQTVSWVSFLGSQEYLKDMVFRYHNKKHEEYELSNLDLTFVSTMVCLCNTVFVMPVDYIKTHYQKFDNSSKNTAISQFVAQAYRKGGIRQFYRGVGPKLIQYNINAYLTVQLFEKILRSYEH